MFDILNNLARAGVAIACAPVAAVADVIMLPKSAYEDQPAFARAGAMLNAASDCIKAAVDPKGVQ